jgi:hypothetical protein
MRSKHNMDYDSPEELYTMKTAPNTPQLMYNNMSPMTFPRETFVSRYAVELEMIGHNCIQKRQHKSTMNNQDPLLNEPCDCLL